MHEQPIQCHLVLKSSDFVLANHHVHRIPVLPGVVLLDVVYRVLAARGVDTQLAVLNHVLFSQAIAAGDGSDRELRITCGAAEHGEREVRVESRAAGDRPLREWEENVSARLRFSAAAGGPGAIDLTALMADSVHWRDMAELYAQARREEINHGLPMTCHGRIRQGPGFLLAELDLDPSVHGHADGFYIHPAALDAATLVAFARTPELGQPFIPIYLDSFRAPQPLRGRCYVHVPGPEFMADTGDVLRNDFTVHNEQGDLVASFGGLTCKRIRFPALLSRPATRHMADHMADHMAGRLAEVVAAALGGDADRVDPTAGFYELGLDSKAMVRISRDLEEAMGEPLYPTLLFEFGTIDALATHLIAAHPDGARRLAACAGQTAAPKSRGVQGGRPPGTAPPGKPQVLCYQPVWQAASLSDSRENGVDIVVLAGNDSDGPAIDALASGGCRVVRTSGDPAQVSQIVDEMPIARNGGPRFALVGLEAGQAYSAAWALCSALSTRTHVGSTRVRAFYASSCDSAGPAVAAYQAAQGAALGALARTIGHEMPALDVATVGLEPALPPDEVAAAVLAELTTTSQTDHNVRYLGMERQVRRFRPLPLPLAAGPGLLGEGLVYLVAGGGGGLGGLVADLLAGSGRARLALIGRRTPRPELLARMDRWRAEGAQADYIQADVADAAQASAAVDRARANYGRVDCVIHCAGVIRDALFPGKTASDMAAVLAPKIAGAIHLDEATCRDDLKLFLVFSSLAATIASVGQCDYAYANAFLEHFAAWRAACGDRPGRTLAIAWPFWEEGGMRVPAQEAEHARRADGLWPLPTRDGLDTLVRALAMPADTLVVAYGERAAVEKTIPLAGQEEEPERRGSPAGAVRPDRTGDVAIVGVAGRYPQARDLTDFWQNLLSGKDCVTEVPAERWEHMRFFHPDRGQPGKTYSRWGAFLDDVDVFDRTFFGISRRDAERMDPQERLFLQTAWAAVEDAGYRPDRLAGGNVGVFAGVMWNHYQLAGEDHPDAVAPAAMHSSVANRVSHCLNFTGPSLAVDTACSSSLVAIHLAAQSILRGECAAALAGGVNLTLHPQKYLQLAQDQFLSDDGRCRSFGQGGTGYVPGEGVGAVVLKPLADARASGDHVYAVIRGSMVNNSGRTSGFTVPDPASQAAVIQAALSAAGVRPADIGYIEAHGTGTELGDPIEFDALSRVFAAAGMPAASCPFGSVKSNIGHLESAAGIAAVTKVLLQFKHRTLVPSLHAEQANPLIDTTTSPLRLQRTAEPWPVPPAGSPWLAGISSFGAGGTNAHLILEAGESAAAEPARSHGPFLFVLSAKDPDALRRYARSVRGSHLLDRQPTGSAPLAADVAGLLGVPPGSIDDRESLADLGLDGPALVTLAQRVDERAPGMGARVAAHMKLSELGVLAGVAPDSRSHRPGDDADTPGLADICYTLQVGRTPMPARLALVVSDLAELREALDGGMNGQPAARADLTLSPRECRDLFQAGRLQELAARWLAGEDVPWDACYQESGPHRPRRVALPTYPFGGERCWPGRWQRDRQPAVASGQSIGDVLEYRVLDGGIALLVMRDEAHHNMLDEHLVGLLEQAFSEIASRPDVRAAVITGTDRVFSMGGSPQALADLAGRAARFTDVPFIYEGMPGCPVPVIAAMRGHASGGGLAFGLYADLVVMSREGSYSASFLRYGFTPGLGATYILERVLGAQLAAEMMFTGRVLRGEELSQRGSPAIIRPDAEVLPAALELARSVASLPAEAVRALKAELAGRLRPHVAAAVRREDQMHQEVLGPDTAARVKEHFGKLATFAATGSSSGTSGTGRANGQADSGREGPVARSAVVRAIEDVMCGQLFLDRAELDHSLSFRDMGVDSIGAVEIARDLACRFGVPLDAVAVYDHPTVTGLADAVLALTRQTSELADAADPVRSPGQEGREGHEGQVVLAEVVRGASQAPAPRSDDLAIIGMSGRFPDAPDLGQFWANLVAGHCSITEVPATRFDVGAVFDTDRGAPGRSYSRWAALVSDVDTFDAAFFSISPLEAQAMDPQQRVFLQQAWNALEDAGYAGRQGARLRCGVFVGCAAGDYHQLVAASGEADTAQEFLGDSPSILASRISYFLDLVGPAIAVDTACSSSLVAVHLACESIRSGECDMAVAGGVALMVTPQLHVRSSKAGILSPTGRCAPFDTSADGIVLGEGVGVIVIKRLSQALADGDHIYGVVLATGVNGDGRTNGITAPSAESQAELLRQVQARAGVAPEEIGYVETHGTGTPLGDPIELKALRAVFGDSAAGCALGSVKANIGHTTMAAGIASLLKALLVVRHGIIPPLPQFTALNPAIGAEDAFLFPTRAASFAPADGRRRVAAVSSFGFSGTNSHVIIAAAPPSPPARQPTSPGPLLVPISARTERALREQARQLASALTPDMCLTDIAYTMTVARPHFAVRAAVVARDLAEFRLKLARVAAGGPADDEADGLAQRVGEYLAGADPRWPDEHPEGRRVPLPTYPFASERHWVKPAAAAGGPGDQAVSVSLTLTPDNPLAAHHEVGGVPLLPGAAFLSLAARAARSAGIGLPVRIASVRWLRPLEVRATRHADLRLGAGPDRRAVALVSDGLDYATATLTAAPPAEPEQIDLALVRARCHRRMTAGELYQAFDEAGICYGPLFRALGEVRWNDEEALGTIELPPACGSGAPDAQDELVPANLLDSALQPAALLLGGSGPAMPFALSFIEVLAPVRPPAFCHVTRSADGFSVRVSDQAGHVTLRGQGLVLRSPADAPGPMMFFPAWQEMPDRPGGCGTTAARVAAACTSGGSPLGQALLRAHAGADTIWVPLDDPDVDLTVLGGDCDLVYVIPWLADPSQAPESDPALLGLFRLVKYLIGHGGASRPLTMKVLLDGAVAVDDEPGRPHHAGLIGLLRSVAAECQQWRVGCVDVGTTLGDLDSLTPRIVAEDLREPVVALRGGRRLVRAFRPAPLPVPAAEPYRRHGVYLLVGGAGGIGSALSKHLARTAGARLAWVGRRPVDEDLRGRMAEVQMLGGQVAYYQADVADGDAMSRVVAEVTGRYGPVNGAFHSAAVLADRSVAAMDEAAFLAVLAPKTAGAVALADALAGQPLDFLAYFSSAASFVACPGQANYAAASTFEDAWARSLAHRRDMPVCVINWGYWGTTGVVATDHHRMAMARLGVGSITPAEGIAALSRALAAKAWQVLVVKADRTGLAAFGIEPPVPAGQDADHAAAAFDRLEEVSRVTLCELFATLPAMPKPGERVLVTDLATRLGLTATWQARLLRALLGVLDRAGAVRLTTEGEVTVGRWPAAEAASEAANLLAEHPDMAPHVRLLHTCVAALPDVLAGRRSGTDILFPKGSMGLIEPIYSGQPVTDSHARRLAEQVGAELLAWAGAAEPVRVLEVGAGTGSGSLPALRACAAAAVQVEYTYTDISPAFLRHGDETLGARFPFLRFAVFDVERDPGAQGFPAGGFDLVLATNVLHATASIDQALGHVRQLLRPGGRLLINEVTAPADFLTVTFGLTTGWWRYQDASSRLPDCPLLSARQWRAALTAAGFRDVHVAGAPGTAEDDLDQCVLAAEAAGADGTDIAAAAGYVRRVFAEVLRYREADLDGHVTFENFGVDSLVGTQIIARLEQDLGELSATLLFEHLTIEALASHLARHYGDRLSPAPAEQVRVRSRKAESAPEPRPGPAGPGDIAVIGVSGRYPGAADVDEFWRNLAQGRSTITEIPASRWDWRQDFDQRRGQPHRSYSRWGGFIDGIADFDPLFFGILPRDARAMDPQERLFLEVTWDLLERAGCLSRYAHEPRTGVFAGLMYGTYGQLGATGWHSGQLVSANSAYWSVANRASYFFDFTGPSFAVDSACSSSLTAVHLACDSIRRGECRMAIAGGVNLILHRAHYAALCAVNMLAADGMTKVFDARADGFVPGEGVGAVLLKPLAAAVADDDDIWAVIKGSSVNAGGKTGGYTVPNPSAQADVVADALRRAGVEPETIDYIEAHGTGTALGDPIEIAGLARVFNRDRAPRPCAIGSVKANIGHLEGAAGIAGLTKVLLQLRHSQIAPAVHLDTPNPRIDFDGFFVPRTLTEWPRSVRRGQAGGAPRRAGVSSFGAGGANAHVVIEEYQPGDASTGSGATGQADSEACATELFLLSARTSDQLDTVAAGLASFLSRHDAPPSLRELAFTSQVGRAELPERAAILATDPQELVARLRLLARREPDAHIVTGEAAAGAPATDSIAEMLGRRELAGLAKLWVAHADVDWRLLWPPPRPRRAALPGYPFDRRRLWLDPGRPDIASDDRHPAGAGAGLRYLRPQWRRADLADGATPPRHVLLVVADSRLRDALLSTLEAVGARCTVAAPGPGFAQVGAAHYVFAPSRPEHYQRLVGDLAAHRVFPDAIVHCCSTEAFSVEPGRLMAQIDQGFGSLAGLCTALVQSANGTDVRCVYAHVAQAPHYAAVGAALKTLAQEHSALRGTRVEFTAADMTADTQALAGRLVRELSAADRAEVAEVSYRGGDRWVRQWVESSADPAARGARLPVRQDGVYLVTGGAGALGLRFATLLADEGAAAVVLTGRSEPAQAARAHIDALAARGRTVLFRQADLGSLRAVRALVAAIEAESGGLHGIIHAAGVVHDARAVNKTRDQVLDVLAGKLFGAVHLDIATSHHPLDFIALFSSAVAVTGNIGQFDYAYANAFLNEFADLREQRRLGGERPGRTVSIGWPLWRDGGMTVDPAVQTLLARRWGMTPMAPQAGMSAFQSVLAGQDSVVVVVPPAQPAEPVSPDPDAPAQPAEDRDRGGVLADLRCRAAKFLLVEPDDVDPAADLMDLGFDSIALVEFTNWVNEEHAVDLLPTAFFEHPTLEDFTTFLLLASEDRAKKGPSAVPMAVDDRAGKDIAIIGIAGALPGSPDLDAFWRHLLAGDEMVSPVPADRTDLLAHPGTRDMRGGFLDGVADFDARLFGMSPKEAALADPQQRLFLQTAWRTFEDAGYSPADLAGTDCGLFVGVSTHDYDDLITGHGLAAEAHMATGSSAAVLANRVSHVFDLRGPSEAVDTACSSALVAIHRAVRALRAGECGAALAGAVNVVLSPGLCLAFAKSGMLSPSGRCRVFDAGADGYVRGEGVGAVLLKPLGRAVADGDHVYAIVKGSAVNHCGRAASLTAPNPQAQAAAIVAAHRDAGVDPARLTYLEAHGTGTRLGDPAEIEGIKHALTELFGERGRVPPAEPVIGVGSVKSSIGHLEAAAGIASVLKVVLCMRHGELPATVGVGDLNPYLRLEGTPLRIQSQRQPWPAVEEGPGSTVRVAGISSFGFGGSNAHLVLEARPGPEAAPQADGGSTGDERVLVLSAPTADALDAYAAHMADFLDRHDQADFASVAFTLQTGRKAFAARLAVVGRSQGEWVNALRAAGDGRDAPGLFRGTALARGSDLPEPPDAQAAAAEWVKGGAVSWQSLWPDPKPRRISLPGMPFSPARFWCIPDRQATGSLTTGSLTTGSLTTGSRLRLLEPAMVRSGQAGGEEIAAAGHSITGFLRERLADVLGFAEEEISPHDTFDELGLDSIFRVELAKAISDEWSIDVGAADLYEHDTLARLATFLEDLAAAPALGEGTAGSLAAAQTALAHLVGHVIGRPIDHERTFADNGLTSFDMLRTITALERRLGSLRKTLLFDWPTLSALTGFLCERHGAAVVAEAATADGAASPSAGQQAAQVPRTGDDGPLVLLRGDIGDQPDVAELLARLDAAYGVETGLASRDVAPWVFVGAQRRGYLCFSRRDDSLLAWNYAGPDDYFAELASQWLGYARGHRLRPNLLSLAPLTQADGVALTATPIGAIQRLPDLASFQTSGTQMRRLRYMVRRAERAGACRTVEYRSGSDSGTDTAVALLIDQWAAAKAFVNPYVGRVRDEVAEGRLGRQHRMFLTYVDDALVNCVVITRIPSRPGYLLDVEFYSPQTPAGGLEYAIVQIIAALAAEGVQVFSFGASFGVRVGDSAHAAPEAERALDELRSAGIFGSGNYQFKNKFRPVDQPIYLCQPRDAERTGVADVILMIANPAVPCASQPQRERGAVLAAHGHNPVRIPHRLVETDLMTDSWAEHAEPFVSQRMGELREKAAGLGNTGEVIRASWLPHPHTVAAPSGRAAEALLCQCWPGRRGAVLHNTVFPTWLLSLADHGFTPVPLPSSGTTDGFGGDLDLTALDAALADQRTPVSFLCVETAANAGAGQPLSLRNLREVSARATAAGVPLVIDATRIADNALLIAEREQPELGRDLWEVVREMLGLADAVTLSLSKDFGITEGGLLATGHAELAERLAEDGALRGPQVSLHTRRLIASAINDQTAVAELVRRRVAAVAELTKRLADAGAPLAGPGGGHCVLLDTREFAACATLADPMPSFLAWLYRHSGVRGAPHLVPADHPFARCVRLAVPVGPGPEQMGEVADRVAALFEHPPAMDELMTTSGGANRRDPHQSYFPAEHVPGDIRDSLERGYSPRDENDAVLRERAPAARRLRIRQPGGEVEAYTAGTGPPVLLMHPFNIGAGIFAEQFRLLADTHQLAVVHHPGVGGTTTAADLTLDGITAMIRRVLPELGITAPVHLVGTSFGGLLALTFALSHPDEAASLTLICGSYKYANRQGEVNRLDRVIEEDFDLVLRNCPASRLGPDRRRLTERLLRCESMNPHTGLRYLDLFAGQPNLERRLAEVKVPTLVIQGRHDSVIPLTTARTLHVMIEGARYAEIADAGHFPCVTHPGEVSALLTGFLPAPARGPRP